MGFFIGGFEIIFMLVFFLVIVTMIVTIGRNLKQWNKNNHAPRLVVDAQVVAKRARVGRSGSGTHTASHSYTDYYVTFQVETGDRLELWVNGSDYGMVVEGDRGRMTFQGTRYLGFERR